MCVQRTCPLEACSFLRKLKSSGLGRGEMRGNWRGGGCRRDVLYERGINKQEKERESHGGQRSLWCGWSPWDERCAGGSLKASLT